VRQREEWAIDSCYWYPGLLPDQLVQLLWWAPEFPQFREIAAMARTTDLWRLGPSALAATMIQARNGVRPTSRLYMLTTASLGRELLEKTEQAAQARHTIHGIGCSVAGPAKCFLAGGPLA